MNCHQFDQYLDEYLDGVLPLRLRQEFSDHGSQCQRCHQCLIQAEKIQQALRGMPVPPLPENYVEKQFQKLWAQQSRASSKKGWRYLNHPALAASLLLGILLGGGLMQWLSSNRSPEVGPSVTVALYETREVRFVVNARNDMPGARVTIRIPPHLQMEGYPDRHELTWTTDLKAGPNLLALPLKADMPGSGKVVMMINSDAGVLAEKELVIESSNGRTTSYYYSQDTLG